MPTVAVTNTSPGEQAGSDDTADSPPEPAAGHIRQSDPSDAGSPVEIIWAADVLHRLDRNWLSVKLAAVCEQLDRPAARVTVRVVNDDEMSQLHMRHANILGTTDVLTFDASEPNGPIDVDIAVCVDEASRQAGERGHSVERELLLYMLHGVLHCMGFDDHTDDDYDRMHTEEDRLLQAIGVDPTFNPTPGLTESAQEDPDSAHEQGETP